MKTGASLKNRQGGAVAVMVGISMVMLVGFLALVIDLGHLYIAKTELQNAADAAALAGAKELNGKVTGIGNAVAKAVAIAAQNRYDFSKPVGITIANIQVGNSPTSMVDASGVATDADAANKHFIKVDTGLRTLDTWFAPVFNLITGGGYSVTSTFGMAVAGQYLVDIMPIAMCALDVSKCPSQAGAGGECGFERGKAYDVGKVNEGAGGINPGTVLFLDPLATTNNCTVTSTDDGRPFFCQGKASVNAGIGAKVYTNTGNSGPLYAALDSRFNDYPAQGQCDAATAPPDENIREYLWNDAGTNWMSPPLPTGQTANVTSGKSVQPVLTDNQGVVWSFVRPEGNPISGRSPSANYQASPWTPYKNLVTAPTGASAAGMKPDRRVLNIVLVACPSNLGGNCRETTVEGVGSFLMQRKASSPPDRGIFVEFGGLVPGGPRVAEIKLYK